MNAAGAVLEAGDQDADAARSALAGLLPAGTIDPQGTALDLACEAGRDLAPRGLTAVPAQLASAPAL